VGHGNWVTGRVAGQCAIFVVWNLSNKLSLELLIETLMAPIIPTGSGQRHPSLVEPQVNGLSIPVLPASIVTCFNFVNTVTVVVDGDDVGQSALTATVT